MCSKPYYYGSRNSSRSAPVWLENGDAVENMYSEMRGEARGHARVRNAYFEQNQLQACHPKCCYMHPIFQVYLDFGLAIPKLSVHGMISTVKELLELAPMKKVMFSTDGCAFPENFYLGLKQ